MTYWATPLLLVLILGICYSQWRIANLRVLADLFVRRLNAYNKIRHAVVLAMHQATVGPQELSLFSEGRAAAEFLFGEDVLEYLQQLHEDFAFLHTYTEETIDTLSNRDSLREERIAVMLRIDQFFENSPGKFAPYMRMYQKNTPAIDALAALAARLVKAVNWQRRDELRFADMRRATVQVDFPDTTGSFVK